MKTSEIIPRQKYLARIRPYMGKGVIKVLTGQRRVGKSYLLESVEDELRTTDPEGNFITINLEDYSFAHITDASTLHGEIMGKLSGSRKNYIFIDEIQEIDGFDRVVRSLNLDPRNDIYVTGSNSAMLSSEIASRLAGRSVEIRVHPLSYTEFLTFHSMTDSDEAVNLYLQYGGLPFLRNLPSRDTWMEYLTGVTDALVYRDIVSRHSIRNNDFLQRLMLYMADNIGKLFTAKRITDYLKSQHISSSVNSVQTYVDYICEAYVVNKSRRWDIEGKRHFEIGEKYYFEDLGIRNAIIGYRPDDISGLLENIVYSKLVSDGYEVKTGVIPKGKEIDFVAEKGSEQHYFQVAVRITDPSVAEREFGNLASIPDNYQKTLVTLRDSAPNTKDGIRMVSLREFLLTD